MGGRQRTTLFMGLEKIKGSSGEEITTKKGKKSKK